MERDIQFEIQYLLSIIVVILGIVGASREGEFVNEYVGIIFVIISTLHLLFLNTYYAFNQISGFRSPYVNNLKDWSENTLFLVSLSFIYVVFHIIVTIPPDYLGGIVRNCFPGSLGETLANYLNVALPLVPTAIMGGAFWLIGMPTFRLSRNLSTNVLPEQLKIYPDYTDQRTPLMFEIKNDGYEEYGIEIKVELPDKVVAKDVRQDEEFIDAEFSQTWQIERDSRKDLQLRFRHDRTQRETAVVNFIVSHDKGSMEKTAILHLR